MYTIVYKAHSFLVCLSTEGATFSQASTTTSGLTQDSTARRAQNDGLSVAEDGANVQTTRTLDIHEVGVGRLNKSLELVGTLLVFNRRVKKINGQLLKKTVNNSIEHVYEKESRERKKMSYCCCCCCC